MPLAVGVPLAEGRLFGRGADPGPTPQQTVPMSLSSSAGGSVLLGEEPLVPLGSPGPAGDVIHGVGVAS
jgi:hypothetical protein